MGEMLKETERAEGGRPSKTSHHTLPVSDSPTLSDLGLTRKESARAQTLASVPSRDFERIKADIGPPLITIWFV